jgi:hypothetical protein
MANSRKSVSDEAQGNSAQAAKKENVVNMVTVKNSQGQEVEVPADKVERLSKYRKLHLIMLLHCADVRLANAENTFKEQRAQLAALSTMPQVHPAQVQGAVTVMAQDPRINDTSVCDNPSCQGGRAKFRCDSRGNCVRCQGKGYQTDADRRANFGYDANNQNGVRSYS